jgi:hypothetical protein
MQDRAALVAGFGGWTTAGSTPNDHRFSELSGGARRFAPTPADSRVAMPLSRARNTGVSHTDVHQCGVDHVQCDGAPWSPYGRDGRTPWSATRGNASSPRIARSVGSQQGEKSCRPSGHYCAPRPTLVRRSGPCANERPPPDAEFPYRGPPQSQRATSCRPSRRRLRTTS